MADLALERIKPNDARRRQEIEAICEQALCLQTCHFTKLPFEIMSTIFTFIARGTEARVLALSLVCRSWRSIILETPALWRKLIISKKTSNKKIMEWLKRSRGRIYEIELRDIPAPDARQRAFSNLQWEHVRSLSFHSNLEWDPQQRPIVPVEVSGKLRLRELFVNLTMSNAIPQRVFFHQLFGKIDISCLRVFELRSSLDVVPNVLMETAALTRLVLECIIVESPPRFPYYLIDVLTGQGMLEELEICSAATFVAGIGTELNHLRHLRLVGSAVSFLSCIHCPNLESLSLEMAKAPINSPFTKSFVKLQRLRLKQCLIKEPPIIQILENAENLGIIELSGCYPEDALFTVLTSLASPEREDPFEDTRGFLCPRLVSLCLNNNAKLTSVPITTLVKSRIQGRPSRTGSEGGDLLPFNDLPRGCLPLKALDISDCSSINPETLPWLREKVPLVIYKMTKEKKVKGRRALWL